MTDMLWIGVGVIIVAVVAGLLVGLTSKDPAVKELRRADRERQNSHAWARPGDLGELRLSARDPSRLQLGLLGSTIVAAPPRRSVLVLAPTGAGKTPRVAVGMVLRHTGPAVVGSVKPDILWLTMHHRRSRGPVWVLDITGASGLPSCKWSPLHGIATYADALKAAAWLSESSKAGGRGVENEQYWSTLGDKLMAPLLFAAARTGRTMADVCRWVDLQAESEVKAILNGLGDEVAMAAWIATCSKVDRTKSSIFGTAEVVLFPFGHPEVAEFLTARAGDNVFTPARLVDEGGTLYLVAPASDQALFTPVFETVTNAVVREVERRAAANVGLPLDPPLLLCLDEAANTAPLRKLDEIASSGANQGIVLASFWQDEGQIERIYGRERARTVISNHTVRLFLPGISDDDTLDRLSRAIGDHRVRDVTVSRDSGAARSARQSQSARFVDERLAPVSWLRQLAAGTGIALTGRAKPVRLALPGWWETPELLALIEPTVRDRYNAMFGSVRGVPARPRPTSANTAENEDAQGVSGAVTHE